MEENKETKLVFENDFIADYIIKQDQRYNLYKCVKYTIFNEAFAFQVQQIQEEMFNNKQISEFNVAKFDTIYNDKIIYQYCFVAQNLNNSLNQYNKKNIEWDFIINLASQVLETLHNLQIINAFLPEVTPDKIWINSKYEKENFLLCDFILKEASQFDVKNHRCYKKYYSPKQAEMLQQNKLSFPEIYQANLYNLAIILLELGANENELTQALDEKQSQEKFSKLMNKIIDKFENKFNQDCPKIQHFGNCLKKMLGLQSSSNYYANDILKELAQNDIIVMPSNMQKEEELQTFKRLISLMENEFEENLIANRNNQNKFTIQMPENEKIEYMIKISLLKNNLLFVVAKKDKSKQNLTIEKFVQIFKQKQSYDQIFQAYQQFQFTSPQEVYDLVQYKISKNNYMLEKNIEEQVVFSTQDSKISLHFNEKQPNILKLQMIFELFVPPSGIAQQDINLIFELKKIDIFNLTEQLLIDEQKGRELIETGEQLYKLGITSKDALNAIQMQNKLIDREIQQNKEDLETLNNKLQTQQKFFNQLQEEKNQLKKQNK